MKFRKIVKTSDVATVDEIVTSTGYFNSEEIAVAIELVVENLNKGIESGYEFIFLEIDSKTVGYSAYGKIPGTKASYALYWIAVHDDYRNQGLGKVLLAETEKDIFSRDGLSIYVETSSRPQYISTRKFYENNAYTLKTIFEDYYDFNDDLVFYLKKNN